MDEDPSPTAAVRDPRSATLEVRGAVRGTRAGPQAFFWPVALVPGPLMTGIKRALQYMKA